MTKSLEKAFDKNKIKGAAKKSQPLTQDTKVKLCTWGGLIIGLLISAGISLALYQIMVTSAKHKQTEELVAQKAVVASEHIEAQVKKLEKQIVSFIGKPGLQEALAANDNPALERYVSQMQAQISGVKSVSFIGKGKSKLDNTVFPPIRYSELDLIQRAERGELIRAEAVKFEGIWYLNFVKVLAKSKVTPVIGTILVRMDREAITEGLDSVLGDSGSVVIEQRFDDDKGVPFFEYGNGISTLSQSTFISRSHWHVVFSPSQALIDSLELSQGLIYSIIAVLFALFGSLGYLNGRRLGNRLKVVKEDAEAEAVDGGEKSDKSLRRDEPKPELSPLTADVLDIDISDADEDILGLEDDVAGDMPVDGLVPDEEEAEKSSELDVDVPSVIFRAYDIRGLAKEQVTPKLAKLVGQSLGSDALDNDQDTLIVARDARLHSPELAEWLVRGILSTGCNVLNIGTVPTPLLYFATETLGESQSGVIVTASHNPGEYNGFKVVMNGKSRSGDDIQAIRKRILRNDFHQGSGVEHRHDIVNDYIDTIFSDVALAGDISIVVDAGNGVTGVVAPRLFEELGCSVTPLFCDLDGNFPNHPPDPSVEANLQALIDKVKDEEADLGVAFDGDGDRIAVVTPRGKIIWPDRLLMLFAKDIVSRNPGADVVFDVKCTRHLSSCITSYGGRPIMWKTGHSPMKSKMVETGALVGGEYSGHIFIKDRWFGFDDGMYAAARLIEILSLQGESLDMMFEDFPESPCTPEVRIDVDEERKFKIIEELKLNGNFEEAKLTLIDGVRADFPYGWGLVRASNTSAHLTLRFEADDEGSLHHIKSLFVKELRVIDNSIQVNWDQ